MKFSKKIFIRKANYSDIEFLWYLRNQSSVSKYSRQQHSVNWKEHVDWVLPILLGVKNKEIFLIQNYKTLVGQIRFDFQDSDKAEVSISLLDEFRGKGFAAKSLSLAIAEIKKRNRVKILIATINLENIASRRLFEKLNFKLDTTEGKWMKYILQI
ncbi:MAG: GNAT family N-acetyltransferase [Patescibacteria group bacterium]|nr:GNAT family N-acetyltransferase [Patescibacteria group bacterium]